MRILLLLFISFYSLSAPSQSVSRRARHTYPFLVAKNNKHSHWYRERKPLKITYADSSGNIVTAKGRLFINDSVHIELDRHHGKIISIINPANIISIERWSGPAWVTVEVLSGVGLLIGIPTFTALNGNNADIALIFPALITITDAYFIVIDIPIIILSKALSVRSQKKGYHYSIRYD